MPDKNESLRKRFNNCDGGRVDKKKNIEVVQDKNGPGGLMLFSNGGNLLPKQWLGRACV